MDISIERNESVSNSFCLLAKHVINWNGKKREQNWNHLEHRYEKFISNTAEVLIQNRFWNPELTTNLSTYDDYETVGDLSVLMHFGSNY